MTGSPDRLGDHNRRETEFTGIARTVTITNADYLQLTTIVTPVGGKKPKWDSIFSVGSNGEIFPYVRPGKTPEPERHYVRGTLRVLDDIADQAVDVRGETGRFFVNDRGVFFKDRGSQLKQCLRFEITKPPGQ